MASQRERWRRRATWLTQLGLAEGEAAVAGNAYDAGRLPDWLADPRTPDTQEWWSSAGRGSRDEWESR